MPTDLPLKTPSERRLSIPNLLFFVFYLTCFVVMAINGMPLLSDAFATASP